MYSRAAGGCSSAWHNYSHVLDSIAVVAARRTVVGSRIKAELSKALHMIGAPPGERSDHDSARWLWCKPVGNPRISWQNTP